MNASREETDRLSEKPKPHVFTPEIHLTAANETDKHSIKLPIITHTCATPIATPSTSIRNLIIPIGSPKRRKRNDSASKQHETIETKQQRKSSLDLTVEFNEVFVFNI